jgi:HlyD family secretion protein
MTNNRSSLRSRLLPLCAVLTLGGGDGLPAAESGGVAGLGQIVPGERVLTIAAPAYAIVDELRVGRGAWVQPGDILAVLREAPVHRARVHQAEQQLALAQAELALVQAGERQELVRAQEALVAAQEAEDGLLRSRLDHFRGLAATGLYEKDKLDELQHNHDALVARTERERRILESLGDAREEEVAKAEIAVRVAQAQVAIASAELEQQYLRAPIAGEVLRLVTLPGESVGESGAVLSLGDTRNMRVLAEIYESDLPGLTVGRRVRMRGETLPAEVQGEIVEIERLLGERLVFPLDPAAQIDRRIAIARIRPDTPEALSGFSNAHVIVTIEAP